MTVRLLLLGAVVTALLAGAAYGAFLLYLHWDDPDWWTFPKPKGD